MAQPREEQIMDNLIATLLSITTANGYNKDIKQAERKTSAVMTNFTDWPAADLWIDSTEKTDGDNEGHRDCHMIVDIGAYTDDRDDPDQALSYLAADIEKALMVDHTRGSLVIDTNITGHEHAFGDPSKPRPTGGVFIRLDIHYRHRITDPYNT